MELTLALVGPITAALIMAVKQAPPFKDGGKGWWLPWIACGIGMALTLAVQGATLGAAVLTVKGVLAALVFGITFGLSAVGLYEIASGTAAAKKGGGSGGALRPPIVLLLVLGAGLALSIGGCAAPLSVREAHAFEEAAWRLYMANGDRIAGAWSAAYAEARRADIEYTTAKAIDAAKRAAAAGPLSPEDLEAAIRTVVEEREKAQAATARVQASLAALQRQNALEAAKALRLHGGMGEWLAAGVEESTIPGLVDEFLTIIRAGGLVPAANAGAAPPAP